MHAKPLKIRRVVIAAMMTGLFLALAFQGCGKKGDPVPPRVVKPSPVKDLKASLIQGNISLNWSMPAGGMPIEKIRIFRSELEIAGDDCPSCPRRFMAVADLLPGDSRIARQVDGRLSLVDSNLKSGWLYTYKIIVCDSYGNCSEDSNMTEVKVKE